MSVESVVEEEEDVLLTYVFGSEGTSGNSLVRGSFAEQTQEVSLRFHRYPLHRRFVFLLIFFFWLRKIKPLDLLFLKNIYVFYPFVLLFHKTLDSYKYSILKFIDLVT